MPRPRRAFVATFFLVLCLAVAAAVSLPTLFTQADDIQQSLGELSSDYLNSIHAPLPSTHSFMAQLSGEY